MEYKTSISKMTDDDHVIRGEKLSSLIGGSFSDAIFLILKGEKPNEKESKIFEALLISIIDHGMGTSSSMTARMVASTGNSVNAAIAGGVLALGDFHGGAIQNAMKQLQEVGDAKEFVATSIEHKNIIFGFGHKVYKEGDPRVLQVLDICKEVGYESKFIDLVKEIESEFKEQKGKKIVLNIDGLIAAVLLEMGFSDKVGKSIFTIGRTPGLAAQAIEEMEDEKPVRRINEEDITYEGK